MEGIRLSIAIMLGWLLVIYNVERFHEPINIASYIYVACGLVGTLVVLVPRAQKCSAVILLVFSVCVVCLKPVFGYEIFGSALPLSVTETFLLFFTALVAQRIGRDISRAQHDAKVLATNRANSELVSFEKRRTGMYLEVRRARKHERPLTVVALQPEVDLKQAELNMPRWLTSFHEDVTRHYLYTRIAETLVSLGEGCVTVAEAKDKLVLLLPEYDKQSATEFVSNVQERVSMLLEVDLRCGLASFPDEEVTLEGLLERAASNLQEDQRLPAPSGVVEVS